MAVSLNSYDQNNPPTNPNLVASPFLPVPGASTSSPAAGGVGTDQDAQIAAKAAQLGATSAQETDPVTGQPKVNPATSQPGYDPNNPQPYQDQSQIPGVSNIPSAASALPPEEPIQHLGAVTPAGAGAYVADKLFRGYLQGRAVADMRKAVELQKTSTGLNALYHTAAENLYNLAQKGVDPQSDEFLAARNQANAAWQAQIDFLGQHIQAQKTDKKTGKQVPDQGNLLQRIFKPNDPAEIAPAIYEGMQKTGPPVFHQIAPFLTPDYQAKVQQRAQTQGTAAQTAQTVQQNQQTMAANKQEFDQLNSSTTPLTPQQEQRKQQLYNAITLNPSTAAGAPNPGTKWLPIPGSRPYEKDPGSGQYYMAVRNPTNGAVVDRLMPPDFKPTPTSVMQGRPAWSKDETGKYYQALYSKDTDQELPGTRNYGVQPPRNIVGNLNSSSHTDANGVTTKTSAWAGPAAGPAEPTSATPPAAPGAQPSATTTTPAPQSNTTAPPLQPHPGQGTSGALHTLPPNVPKFAAPIDPSKPSVAPYAPNGWPTDPNPNVPGWAYRLNTGQAKQSDVPSSLRSSVSNYMTKNNIETVLPETAALQNSEAAMKDVAPALTTAMNLLEPYKDQGGLFDALGQRMKYGEYKIGMNPGPVQTAINQWTAFAKIAAASPWSKVGRGITIFKADSGTLA